MMKMLGNIVSVLFSAMKFLLMKLRYGNRFTFGLIERFSPNTTLRLSGGKEIRLGNRVSAHSRTKICCVAGGSLRIGDGCSFNTDCQIICRHSISIGSGVEFGPGVLVYDHDHDVRAEGGLKARKFVCDAVTIGEGSWIGANTVILRGTNIGRNCVIGAGSVVKGNIPDNTILIQKRENTFVPIT